MQGRIARGVTVMKVDDDDHVTSMAILTPPDAPEEKGVTPRIARRSAANADAEAKPATEKRERKPRPPHGQAAADIEIAARGAEQLGMPLEDLGLEDDDAEDEEIVDEADDEAEDDED